MSLVDESADDTMVEECVAELEELITGLDRYPPPAVAVAMCIYLEGLLGALLDESQCTADEVRELLGEIELGLLGAGSPDEP